MDIYFQQGVQWTIGQTPCPPEDQLGPSQCLRRPQNITMIHRGDRMIFIDYVPGATGVDAIINCTWMDVSIVGNVRPDWFLDKRGAASDVQYIGDSHVFHRGEPMLVKQWRKKDLTDQYFTMSMQRTAGEDGVHWPLIL